MQFYIARVRGEQKVPWWPRTPEAALTIVISPTFSPVPEWSMKDRLLRAEECGKSTVGKLPDLALSAVPPWKIHSATVVAEPFAFSAYKLLQLNMQSRQPCWGVVISSFCLHLGDWRKEWEELLYGLYGKLVPSQQWKSITAELQLCLQCGSGLVYLPVN